MRALKVLAVVALFLRSGGAVLAQEPVKLRIGYYHPPATMIHQHVFVPLAEGLNKESGGRIEASLHPGGELGADPTQQLQLLQDGKVDITYLAPSYTPNDFPDHEVMDLAIDVGSTRAANLLHQRLYERGLLRGYEKVHVIGAVSGTAGQLHAKFPITSLDSLQGRTIRAERGIEQEFVKALGGKPVAGGNITETADALRGGTVDGTVLPWGPARVFKVFDVTSHHVDLSLSRSGSVVAMNKAKYESLPSDLKQLVDRFSGNWFVLRFAESQEIADQRAVTVVRGLQGHEIVELSADQRAQILEKVEPVVKRWAQEHPNGEAIVAAIREESRKLRE
jgi:TRAP-type C4-dicarboxylate transport system substrate-binding protein